MPFRTEFTRKEQRALQSFLGSNPTFIQIFQTNSTSGLNPTILNQFLSQFPKIARWLIKPLSPSEATNLRKNDLARISNVEKITRKVIVSEKQENISIKDKYKFNRRKNPESIKYEILLNHLKALKVKGYTDLYIRFGDGSEIQYNKAHHENFQCFFGGIKPNSNNYYYKKDGNDFIDVNGNSINKADARFSYFEKRNSEIYGNGIDEYYECKSIGGLIHNIDEAIDYFRINYKDNEIIYLLPGYDTKPDYVDNAPCKTTEDPKGMTTIIFSNKKIMNDDNEITTMNALYADRGNGCCPQ